MKLRAQEVRLRVETADKTDKDHVVIVTKQKDLTGYYAVPSARLKVHLNYSSAWVI